jgi:DNA-binding beta-propeller fold protein YncE
MHRRGGRSSTPLDALTRFPNLRLVRWGPVLGLLATVVALVLPASAAAFGPLSSYGEFGSEDGELNRPFGIAVAADGSSYVAELDGGRVSIFDAEGDFQDVIGAGDLSEPLGVAFGPEGNLFVSDHDDNRIVVYTPEGELVDDFGGFGEGAGLLDEPAGIQFDQAGLLYVAAPLNARVDVFTAEGEFVYAFGKEVNLGGGNLCTTATGCQAGVADGTAGAMNLPVDVELGPAGEIAVADEGNHRIDVFDAAGVFVRALGKGVNPGLGDPDVCTEETGCQEGSLGLSEEAGGLDHPSALAVSPAGSLYVADVQLNRVAEFGFDGTFVRAFGGGVINGAAVFQICTEATTCQGGLPSTFFGATPEPRGLAFDCRGALYVTEEEVGFARVARFGEPGTAPPPCVSSATPLAKPIATTTRPPSNRFRFVGLVKNRRNGSAVLFVRVPSPGRLLLFGRGVRRLRRGAGQPKVVRLPVKPKVRLVHFLKRHGKGRIRVEVVFEPTGGTPRTREKVIVLKRKRQRR